MANIFLLKNLQGKKKMEVDPFRPVDLVDHPRASRKCGLLDRSRYTVCATRGNKRRDELSPSRLGMFAFCYIFNRVSNLKIDNWTQAR